MKLTPATKSLLLPTVHLWTWREVGLQLHYDVLAEQGAHFVTLLTPCCRTRFTHGAGPPRCGRCSRSAHVVPTVRWVDVTSTVVEDWLALYYPALDPLALTLLQDELRTAVSEKLDQGMPLR